MKKLYLILLCFIIGIIITFLSGFVVNQPKGSGGPGSASFSFIWYGYPLGWQVTNANFTSENTNLFPLYLRIILFFIDAIIWTVILYLIVFCAKKLGNRKTI